VLFLCYTFGKKGVIVETLGINYTFLAFQILNLALIITHITLSLMALSRLWRGEWNAGQKLFWTLLILFIPLLGPLAFLWATRRLEQVT
jgi:hypothetical protein